MTGSFFILYFTVRFIISYRYSMYNVRCTMKNDRELRKTFYEFLRFLLKFLNINKGVTRKIPKFFCLKY